MISTIRKELHEAFNQVGWTEPEVGSEELAALFDGLFVGSYAVCAVCILESSREAIERWPQLQGALAELKGHKGPFGQRDVYLLFIADKVDDMSLGALQNVLDDTRVCRKICLERGDRSILETLSDIPFFAAPGTHFRTKEEPTDAVDEYPDLPSAIQADLESRGAERILTKLLNGEYEATR